MNDREIEELVAEMRRVDQENEHLRMRVLDVMTWMEEAVTEQVACERRLAEVEGHARDLQTELDAIHRTRTWRLLAPLRRAYAGVRGRAVAP